MISRETLEYEDWKYVSHMFLWFKKKKYQETHGPLRSHEEHFLAKKKENKLEQSYHNDYTSSLENKITIFNP